MAKQGKKERLARSLSDLERVVLGVIWRDGPCTAYRVRQEFAESPTSHWSGSQGAIYPLIRKLESHGLVTSLPDASDQRKTRLLTITSEGKRQLAAWFDPKQSDESLLLEYDVIRTRMFFIHVLSPTRRKRYFDHLEERLFARQKQIASELNSCSDDQLLNRIAWEGLLATNNAKLDWLASARRLLE